MGFYFRRRYGGQRAWMNVSKSGLSLSFRVGRVTYNTRHGFTLRGGKGWGYKINP